MRIKLVNSIGAPGKEALDNIEKLLLKMDHKVAQKGEVKQAEPSPVVYFKPHAKAMAGVIAEHLDHPKTRLDVFKKDTEFDLEIVWGTEVKKDDKGKPVSADHFGPDVVDDKVAEARRSQNKALAKPEKVIQDVDRTVSTPERTIQAGKDAASRSQRTLEKAKGTYEKVKGLTIPKL